MEDGDENIVDDGDIVKPVSAYHHYSKINSSRVKEDLLREGKDTSLGVVVSIVAAKWKALQDDEKAPYEAMAREDRVRYNRECSIRDEEVLMMQEERRKANAMTATDTRMRGTTIRNSDATDIKEANKRTREISDKEKEKHAANKQARLEREGAIQAQLDELKATKAQQAEARLKFLLAQSDIFSHFGSVKAGAVNSTFGSSTATTSASGGSKSDAKSSRRNVSSEALDEDEKAIAQEELDDEEGGGDEAKHHGSTMLTKQPSIITGGAMRQYQLEGLNWMIRLQDNGINGILADEMGLGKTLQSISVVAYMREFRNVLGPHLIMVPKSTLSNWCNEFKRWCPEIRVLRFHGAKDERQEIVSESLRPGKLHEERDWDVCVTTYEIVNLEKNALSKIAWNYLIIDEAHRLKNEASQFSQTVRLLNTEHRLLLTGTPLQNNLHELWALLNFLLPDVFASSEQFDDWFDLDVDDTEAKQRIIGQLHKLLRPFMLRRLKADVEKSLPPKSETILFTGMSAIQKNLYKNILMRDIDTIQGAAGKSGNNEGSRTAILNIVMQLRKCCNHPYLFPGIEDRSENPMGEHLYQSCGKMVLLDKLLAKLKQRDHRVLIFSQMTRMLDILEDYLISQGYKYCRIDGNTTYEEREDRIYDYNKPDSDKFVFILSTRAGGLGINLQTADTVILYDSDWNPQADLQAQDRAHRIGQKKPVQVFRLVTDETVEVKVVERAQQKLKLDAMVVQQGRLQEKERKLTKQDLLDTLRFGADKIFRSKDSTISDADIDMILEEGRKRTDELNSKLTAAEKGDIYDFRLDGGMSTQTYEGIDYSSKQTREDEKAMALASLFIIDVGKREVKKTNYSETVQRPVKEDEGDKKQKLPRHLRLPKMEDWQFFDKARLNELQAEEIRLFDSIEEKEKPQSGMITKFVVLPPEQQEEKQRLIAEAFGDWTKVHFNNFVRASAKHGRSEYEKIAKDVMRPLDETKRYAAAFWEKGSSDLQSSEWDRVTKQIEKGEKRLEEISRLTTATAKLIMMFDDPWEELTFRNVGNQGRIFNAVEDRFLLCLTHLHGYGSWDQVRNSVRRCERFRFDFYLQSCSADAIGKRCELLMRSAERELLEIERKRHATESTTSASARLKATNDVVKERMAEITKQIAEESKRLAATRSALQKVKSGAAPAIANTVTTAAASSSNANIKSFFDSAATTAKEGSASTAGKKGAASATGASGRPLVNIVAEEYLPELVHLLKAAGADGISKVVDAFLVQHPLISKRQVELKIFEIAVKEKRPEDNYKIWHIKDEYQHYLTALPGQPVPAKLKAESKSASKGAKGKDEEKSGTKTAASTPKRKRDDAAAESVPPASTSKDAPSSNAKAPKKYKRAFGFFVKAKRAEAEAQLGENASKTDALRDLLTQMWEKSPPEVREVYNKLEREDELRYERELALYEKSTQSTESSAKKSKV